MNNNIRFGLSLLFLCFFWNTVAQSPQKFTYQAVVRNSDNNLITNKLVGVQISILQTSPGGLLVFQEQHNPLTNTNGLFSIEVGNGNLGLGDFTLIDWSDGPYFIRTEIDPLGGVNYSISGTTQLLSVPYALHAASAKKLTDPVEELDPVFNSSIASGITLSDTAYWNTKLSSEIDGSVSNELQFLSISTDTVFLSNGGFVKLPPVYAGTNTDSQQLTISNDTLFLSNGGKVKLPASKEHFVGELYGGGIVFYVDSNGNHGLIASLDDLNNGAGTSWGLINMDLSSSTNSTDGATNTINIINAGSISTDAANLCDSYNGGGFSDWYLPSYWELSALSKQAPKISICLENDGLANTKGLNISIPYWSSTDATSVASSGAIWYGSYSFLMSGERSVGIRTYPTYLIKVRAIRSF